MGDIAMILVVGGIALYGLYAYNQGAFGTPGTTTTDPGTTTTTTDPVTNDPLPATNATCQQEGGIWQGFCCSCPNNNCKNKCGGGNNVTQRDACTYEGGQYEPNTMWGGVRGCCRCPNIACSRKCGSRENPSGGKAGTISMNDRLAGVCKSEGAGNVWSGNRNCCQCPNKTCQHKCPGPRAPIKLKDSDTTPGAKTPAGRSGTQESRGKSTGGGVGGSGRKVVPNASKSFDKPDPKAGLCQSEGGKWTGKCCSCPNRFCKNKCTAAKYAHSYLAGSTSRRGPSYTGRDDFRHLTNVEFPSPIDFEYEARYRPNWLGPISPERSDLLKRFNAYRAMRFSG